MDGLDDMLGLRTASYLEVLEQKHTRTTPSPPSLDTKATAPCVAPAQAAQQHDPEKPAATTLPPAPPPSLDTKAPAPTPIPPAQHAEEGDGNEKWRALALLVLCTICGMSTWFSAAAVLPALGAEWGVDDATGSLLTIMVNVGFLIGALCSR